MFMLILFFFTFFSSTFFATSSSLDKKTNTTAVVLSKNIDYLDKLKKQYQKIENNKKALEELSTKCEHVGHTLEYYMTEASSIIASKENQDTKTPKIQSLLHDGGFILGNLENYLK